jgi:DNA-binding response OmpR family regulator
MSSDKTQALEAGCDEYDVKPVEWGRLLTKIRALLPPEVAP